MPLRKSASGGTGRRPGWRRLLVVLAGMIVVGLAAAVLRSEPLSDPLSPPLRLSVDREPALHAQMTSDARELVLDFGPFYLPAGADHHQVEQPLPAVAASPAAGWLHGFRVDVVTGNGRSLPSTIIHHVNVIAPERRELFSPIMRRIAAAGHETGEIRIPRLLGLPVREGEGLMVTAMLHNPTDEEYSDVFLRVRFPFTPERRWRRPVAIYPLYLDVMPPASVHAFDLPPGRSERSWEGSPVVSGRLLGVGGHLHRYGVSLVLEDVTRGRVIWEARPILNEEGDVIGMPTRRFLWRLGVPLRSDHVYRLTAVYDNPTGRTIDLGGMGALGGMFRPSRGEAWPPADPQDPEYRLDMELVHRTHYHVGDATAGGAHHH